MERSEISIHEVRIFQALSAKHEWMSSAEIAEAAEVAPRTARAHCVKFVELGLADQAKVFPAHHYRLSAPTRNAGYVTRLRQAADAMGILL